MNNSLSRINTEVYSKCGLVISNVRTESEGKEYHACRFELNGLKIISRNGKVTPKKAGQFVTFWKRNQEDITEPFHVSDPIDFYVITVEDKDRLGQFVFPKTALIKNGILSTDKKEGKRGFRVYPPWDKAGNKQAEKTQQWQLAFFFETGGENGIGKATGLFGLS
ncbi:hypothetical protein FUAX_32640 [Fulvitalea axinellae]|uniref:MepB family protein n=1 Tax=Fulvitalea axinellae TaxID=1182444 RepID=A0AAU9CUZ2_9BACT|nr:hypothetical protein FUAX_32640 [Fulvitalea axinellae]